VLVLVVFPLAATNGIVGIQSNESNYNNDDVIAHTTVTQLISYTVSEVMRVSYYA
jgi:hypothetical protein